MPHNSRGFSRRSMAPWLWTCGREDRTNCRAWQSLCFVARKHDKEIRGWPVSRCLLQSKAPGDLMTPYLVHPILGLLISWYMILGTTSQKYGPLGETFGFYSNLSVLDKYLPFLLMKPDKLLNNWKYEFDTFEYYLKYVVVCISIDFKSTLHSVQSFVLCMGKKNKYSIVFCNFFETRFYFVALAVPELFCVDWVWTHKDQSVFASGMLGNKGVCH